MAVELTKVADALAGRPELLPVYFDTDLVVTPDDNPVYTPAMLAPLVDSIRVYSQLVPGFVCPSPDLPSEKRLCIEGNGRLAAVRLLGRRFWAFDLGRNVPEPERITLVFQHHQSRRAMSRKEIAQRAARYMEITNCTAAEAAKELKISGPTLSRAFGERRIPPELRSRAEGLVPSVRALVAAAPPELMSQVIDYAETLGPNDKRPTRDQVALFIAQKRDGAEKSRKPKPITLRMNGRPVTFTVSGQDTAATVGKDLKAIATKLGEHPNVKPEGWPFLFP